MGNSLLDPGGPTTPAGTAAGGAVAGLHVGDVVAEIYKITKLLGQGGMGQIFEADDLVLHRRVAIKVPLNAQSAEVLLAEARALAALQHPNLPVVHAAGRHRGMDFLVMERLYGRSLEDSVEHAYQLGHPLPLADTLQHLEQIADALHAIHHAGIAHRDVKPENVLLCGKRGLVLIDFGLVVAESTISSDTVYGGSPHYMAPEVIKHDTARGSGHLSDLYSLGVLAFELLTGVVPYNADNLQTLFKLHLEAPIPDVRMFRPNLPADLAALVKELMAKLPGERPQTAEEIVWRLKSIGAKNPAAGPVKRPIVLLASSDLALCGEIQHHLGKWLRRVDLRIKNTGQEAMEELDRTSPHLMLLDLELADMSGVELMMQLHGSEIDIPNAVVALSEAARPQDLELLRRLDVMSFVNKGNFLVQLLEPIVRNTLATPSSRLSRF